MKKFLLLFLLSFSSVDAGIIGKTDVLVRHPLSAGYKKKIEDMDIGDSVLTVVHDKGGIRYVRSPITDIFKRKTNKVVLIKTETGQLLADPKEYFFSFNKRRWIKAKFLTVYDCFMDVSGCSIAIEEVKRLKLRVPAEMYCITLKNPHMYYITDSNGYSILVHNEPTTLMALYLASIPIKIALTTSTALPTVIGFSTLASTPLMVVAPFVALGTGAGWLGVKLYKGIKSYLHHEKCKRNARRRAQATYTSEELSTPPVLIRETQKTVEKLDKVDKLVEKVKKLDNKRPRRGGPSPKEEEKKLREINYKHNHKNSRQMRKSHRTTNKRLDEHVDKLKKYIENPDKYDNRGLLKNASQEQRVRIINERVDHLVDEIEGFACQCEDIQNALGHLELI